MINIILSFILWANGMAHSLHHQPWVSGRYTLVQVYGGGEMYENIRSWRIDHPGQPDPLTIEVHGRPWGWDGYLNPPIDRRIFDPKTASRDIWGTVPPYDEPQWLPMFVGKGPKGLLWKAEDDAAYHDYQEHIEAVQNQASFARTREIEANYAQYLVRWNADRSTDIVDGEQVVYHYPPIVEPQANYTTPFVDPYALSEKHYRAAFQVSNALDLASTLYALSKGGKEIGPVAQFFGHNPYALAAFKIGFALWFPHYARHQAVNHEQYASMLKQESKLLDATTLINILGGMR